MIKGNRLTFYIIHNLHHCFNVKHDDAVLKYTLAVGPCSLFLY